MEFLNVIVIFVVVLYVGTFLIKNNNAYENHIIITRAIHEYRKDCIKNRYIFLVDYDDMEPYYKTLHRLWDWGYKRILPPEKYEIIKPYIGRKNHAA